MLMPKGKGVNWKDEMASYHKSEGDVIFAADGGGSKTRMCLLNRESVILAETVGAGTAAVQEGLLPVQEIIGGMCRQILADVGVADSMVSSGYFSLGGPNTAEVEKALCLAFPHSKIILDREANGNWLKVCAPLLGIDAVLMAGTGSVAAGLVGGEVVFSGGWGPLYDDAGSGYWLGLAALRKVLLMLDGREKLTPLSEILRKFGLDSATGRDFKSRMQIKMALLKLSRSEIAGLAPEIFSLSRTGEPAAMEIILQAADALAGLAASVACCPRAHILGIGGVFKSGEHFQTICVGALKRIRPDAKFVFRDDFDLFKGACIMALTHAGENVGEIVLNNLNMRLVAQ